MKYRKLTIHNIATIEDAVIDFEGPQLKDKPLFLITGVTGSGKTTILDAICLALYDDTPRSEGATISKYEDAGSDITFKDTRNLLRRGAGEGFAELDFIGNDGKNYTAKWAVQRAHKKATGKLQSKQLSLTDGTTTYIKAIEIKHQIESPAIIGLKFDQFCRTSMLAQGEFTRFLSSTEDDKGEILEKIIGVQVYSEMGKKIAEHRKDANLALELKKREMGNITLLSDEEITQKNESLKSLGAQSAEIQKSLDLIAKAGSTMGTIIKDNGSLNKLNQEIAKMEANIPELEAKVEEEKKALDAAFKDLEAKDKVRDEGEKALAAMGREKVDAQRKAATEKLNEITSVIGKYELYQKTNSTLEEDRKNLKATEEEKAKAVSEEKTLSANKDKAEKDYNSATEAYERAKNLGKAWEELIKNDLKEGDECPICGAKISSDLHQRHSNLDSHILQCQNHKKEADIARLAAQKLLSECSGKIKTLSKAIEESQNNITKSENNLKLQAIKLTESCSALGVKADGLNSLKDATSQAIAEIDKKLKVISDKEKEVNLLRRASRDATKVKDQADKNLREITDQLKDQKFGIESKKEVARKTQTDIAENMVALKNSKDILEALPDFSEENISNPVWLCSASAHLNLALKAMQEEKADTDGKIGGINQEIATDKINKQRVSKISTEVAALEEKSRSWDSLYNDFGDVEGKKFRKIALSFILQNLVDLANGQMRKLTDQYTLVAIPGTLNIMVKDAYTGGIERPVSTLSGGEKFIVSLALALGLSGLKDGELGVGTLFIDEGFGTLSDEYLDTVMNMLQLLHEESGGKQVGIISHVSGLKDQISALITVSKDGNSGISHVSVTG